MRLRQRAGNLETTGAIAEKLYVQSAAQRCGATKPIDAARSLQFALLNFETAITKNDPAPKAIDVQRSLPTASATCGRTPSCVSKSSAPVAEENNSEASKPEALI